MTSAFVALGVSLHSPDDLSAEEVEEVAQQLRDLLATSAHLLAAAYDLTVTCEGEVYGEGEARARLHLRPRLRVVA